MTDHDWIKRIATQKNPRERATTWLVFADWLEDQGRVRESANARMVARKGWRPRNTTELAAIITPPGDRCYEWWLDGWWKEQRPNGNWSRDTRRRYRKISQGKKYLLPAEVMNNIDLPAKHAQLLSQGNIHDMFREYPDRLSAYLALWKAINQD